MSDRVPSTIERLRQSGVEIPEPHLVHVTPDVLPERIEAGVLLHPGCRLEGPRTLIRSGSSVGTEGPCRLRNCALGQNVALASGTFEDAVFLDGASCGPSAHVRAGTLFEEGASAAHAVGTKQTLLLPFATLGSNVNFCDGFLAGGSGSRDHSEIGSGFIHFNFTPFGREGDKATPSRFGDVPRGVWLREARIFLGGAGGVVGPASIGFGTILAAGGVYRRDRGEGLLVLGEELPAVALRRDLIVQKRAARKVTSNLAYMADVAALHAFHRHIRRERARDELDRALIDGALRLLEGALKERLKQLERYVRSLPESAERLSRAGGDEDDVRLQRVLPERLARAKAALLDPDRAAADVPASSWEALRSSGDARADHVAWVRSLDDEAVARGVAILTEVAKAYVGSDAQGLLAD